MGEGQPLTAEAEGIKGAAGMTTAMWLWGADGCRVFDLRSVHTNNSHASVDAAK